MPSFYRNGVTYEAWWRAHPRHHFRRFHAAIRHPLAAAFDYAISLMPLADFAAAFRHFRFRCAFVTP